MSMQGDGCRRSAGGAEPILCLALCLMAAGCASIGQALGPSASARGDVSVAFESIDGLPRDLSQQLIRDLNEEAVELRIAVVPAGGEAAYRMRGYLAAHAQGSTTSIAWAWDVYDAELHRAFRLSGEERAGPEAGRNPTAKDPEGRRWAVADAALLRQIARNGMEQLAGFMASAPAPAAPAPPAPEHRGSAVASRDGSRPDTEGLFPGETAAARHSAAVPMSDRGPALAGLTSTARLADAAAGR
jgi:hypothetical protein